MDVFLILLKCEESNGYNLSYQVSKILAIKCVSQERPVVFHDQVPQQVETHTYRTNRIQSSTERLKCARIN